MTVTNDENAAYFSARCAEARAIFPALGWPTFTFADGASIETEANLNPGGLAIYNLPPGFDVAANDAAHHVCYHEDGHGYLHRLAYLTGIPETVFLEQYRVRYNYPLDYSVPGATPGLASIGEGWAETFANAVVGKVVTSKTHLEEVIDPLEARAWFLSLAPGAQPAPQPQPAPAPAPSSAKTYRHMADAAYPQNIPDGFPVVGGYLDGSTAWPAEAFAHFEAQGKTVVRIVIWNNNFQGDMLDLEPKNCTAKDSVPWVAGMWAAGKTPTVYCFSDLGPAGYRISDVRAECDAAGVKRPLIFITKAGDASAFDPNGDPDIVGLQFGFDGTYDESVIADGWPVTTTAGGPKVLPSLEPPVSNTTGGDGGAPVSATPGNAIVRIGQSAERVTVKAGEAALLQAEFEWPSGIQTTIKKRIVSYVPGFQVVEIYPPLDPTAADPIEVRETEPAVFVVTVVPA